MTSPVLKVHFLWTLVIIYADTGERNSLGKRVTLFDQLYDATQAAFLICNMEAE